MALLTPAHLLAFALGTSSSAQAPADASSETSTDTSAESEVPEGPQAPGERPDVIAPLPDLKYVRDVNRFARGVGIGFNQGIWGDGFGQSLSLDIPFGRRVGQFFGLRVAGTFVHGQVNGDYDPVGMGHIDLFGRSPVMAGLVRAYGGGGLRAGGRLHPDAQGRRYGITGGGYVGLEVFVAPRMSFDVEVGVQGPVHSLALDAGGSAMAGMKFWLGDLRKGRR